MTWQGIVGHDNVVDQFRRSLIRGRLASTFLFVGPTGVGKHTFALRLAKTLLCSTTDDVQLQPCGHCDCCQQAAVATHPDLLLLAKPSDRASIPVELLIGDREHRMRSGLCHELAMRPTLGPRKIAILDDADFLNQEGANCLLKTLEEPPPKTIIILIGTSPHRQLPTIVSRCQIVRFQALQEANMAELLMVRRIVKDSEQAANLAQLSRGSMSRVVELVDDDLREVSGELLALLSQENARQSVVSKTIHTFVEDAGKEAPFRRARLRQVIDVIIRYYRQLMMAQCESEFHEENVITEAVTRALIWWSHSPEVAATGAERCLVARNQVDANANLATLVESWVDDLIQLTRGGYR